MKSICNKCFLRDDKSDFCWHWKTYLNPTQVLKYRNAKFKKAQDTGKCKDFYRGDIVLNE